MGHCNSKQQHHRQSAASASIVFDSVFSPTSASGSSSRRRRASIKQGSNISGNKNKRVAASNNDITSCSIGSAIHQKPRLVTHEGDLGSSRTVVSSSTATTDNSVANSSVQADHHSNHEQEKSSSSIAISSVDVYQPPPRHRNHKQHQCTSSSKGSSYTSTNKQKQRQSSSPSTHNNNINALYEVLPQVQGHGIAGQVRTCIHRSTSQHLAVKTITKSQVRRKDRIRREIAFMKQVSHPNIVKLYDVYENDKEVHLVMELCEGGELFDRIVDKAKAGNDIRKRSKKIKSQQHQQCDGSGSDQQQQERPELKQAHHPACYDEREAAHIVHQLLSAVSYLHSVNIIHRDIKPENILLTTHEDDNCNTDDDSSNPASSSSGNDIKLIDFGLSIRHTPNCPPLKNTVGTSYYMAPELLNGTYNRSCDMWSVGVITYVMLSGRPPFNGTSDDVIFKKIRKGQYKLDTSLWDGVSDLAKDFITCLLDMDTERRWSADMALNHAWFAAAGV